MTTAERGKEPGMLASMDSWGAPYGEVEAPHPSLSVHRP